MKILFLGGDKRYETLIKHYKKSEIDLLGYLDTNIGKIKFPNQIDISDYDAIFFPFNGLNNDYIIKKDYSFKLNKNFLINSKKNIIIFSGIRTDALNEMCKTAKRALTVFMDDKNIVKENAIITVEGILGNLINNTEISIKDSSILVIGYGNIGKVLVDYLRILGSNVVVCVKEKIDFNELDKKQIPCFYSFETCKLNYYLSCDYVINTAPENVINEENMKYLNNSYIIDVASYPYGINENINKNNINYNLLSALPNKIAPISSGKILLKKIDNMIGES